MPMVTTCPHCATSFNVEPEILLSRNGRVRCGQCKQIFDGLLSVTTRDEFQAANIVPAAPAADTSATPATADIQWPTLPAVPDVPIQPMPLEVVAAASPVYLPDADAMAKAAITVPTAPPPARALYKAPAIDDSEDDDFDHEAPAAPRSSRWPWALAATLAAIVLAGQVLYRYRSEVAAHLPVAKPVLAQLCEWAECSVPPLQQPAALNIEASDLQVIDTAKPNIVQLTATLRNRAAIEVGYPAFDLVLTDNREHALARRVILPADYLPAPNAGQAIIAANAEITVRVDMDTSGLPAAGFRLTLTPAPSY